MVFHSGPEIQSKQQPKRRLQNEKQPFRPWSIWKKHDNEIDGARGHCAACSLGQRDVVPVRDEPCRPIVNPSKNNHYGTDAPTVVPFVDIASAGPLTHVYIGNELSSQVAHTGDASLEFYPPATIPGDSGTFIAMGGTLYAPDFIAHGGTATGGHRRAGGVHAGQPNRCHGHRDDGRPIQGCHRRGCRHDRPADSANRYVCRRR